MTSLELSGLEAQLRSSASALAARAGYAEVAARLRDAAAELAALQADVLRPMLDHTDHLNVGRAPRTCPRLALVAVRTPTTRPIGCRKR